MTTKSAPIVSSGGVVVSKLPKWVIQQPHLFAARTRKNQKNLTEAQWTNFINAVKAIKAAGAAFPSYTTFVNCHKHVNHEHQAHDFPTFLPWHREYLLHFELRLRLINSSVTIPYWDWTVDTKIPDKLKSAAEWGVTRNSNVTIPGSAKTAVQTAMGKSTFAEFHSGINGPHGSVHMQVGGEMSDIENSPKDVLFWLHHCFLDKLWSKWQAAHPGQDPTGAQMNAKLKPTTLSGQPMFTHKGSEVLKIANLGYKYV